MRGERIWFCVGLRKRTAHFLFEMLAGLTMCSAAWAQGITHSSPTTGLAVSVEQGLLLEHNPLRRSPQEIESGAGGSDSAWTSTLGGRFGGTWGRQRMTVYGRWSQTRYEQRRELDHESHQAGWTLDLQTIGDLTGRLTALRRQDPLEGQARVDPVTGERRLQSLEQLGGTVQWGLQRRWTLELQWQHDRMQPQQPQTWWSGYEQDTLRAQWRWAAGDQAHQPASWALGWRALRGTQFGVTTPTGSQPAQDYRQGVWESEWAWRPRPGDLLSLRAARGQGQREWSSDQAPAMPPATDQDIRSAAAEWRWQPRAQWSVQVQVARDLGLQTQTTLNLLEATGLALQGATDVRQARVSVQWEPTRRVQIQAGVQRVERLGRQAWMWEGRSAALNLDETRWRDRLDRRSWGLAWQLAHQVSLRCTAMREVKLGGTVLGPSPSTDEADAQAVLWRDRGWQCSLGWQGKTAFN